MSTFTVHALKLLLVQPHLVYSIATRATSDTTAQVELVTIQGRAPLASGRTEFTGAGFTFHHAMLAPLLPQHSSAFAFHLLPHLQAALAEAADRITLCTSGAATRHLPTHTACVHVVLALLLWPFVHLFHSVAYSQKLSLTNNVFQQAPTHPPPSPPHKMTECPTG